MQIFKYFHHWGLEGMPRHEIRPNPTDGGDEIITTIQVAFSCGCPRYIGLRKKNSDCGGCFGRVGWWGMKQGKKLDKVWKMLTTHLLNLIFSLKGWLFCQVQGHYFRNVMDPPSETWMVGEVIDHSNGIKWSQKRWSNIWSFFFRDRKHVWVFTPK